MQKPQITYLDQVTSAKLDQELFTEEVGFTLDILMELAGQSVANTVQLIQQENVKYKSIIVLSGPGNNGGDGFVCARHLKQFGFDVTLGIFKEVQNPFFKRLINTCKINDINIRDDLVSDQLVDTLNSFDLIIDALLGFSFKPPLRDPYKNVIECFAQTKTDILSVDIPSGWDVELGNTSNLFTPKFLISLTLPKIGMKTYKGRHFLGGRFYPQKLAEKNGFAFPQYKGSETVLDITNY